MRFSHPSPNARHPVTINWVMQFFMKISGMLLSFLSYPYIFRVLGTVQYGKVAFAAAVLNILIVFANLGIPVYGIRECAKVRDDRQQLMEVAKELLYIQGAASLAASAALLAMVLTSPRMRAEPMLFLIQGLAVIAQAINTEWLYAALEWYSYIAIRNSAVKAFFVVMMFLLIKKSSDYLVYAALLVGPIVASNVINLILAREIGTFRPGVKWQNIRNHLGPALLFFIQAAAISIYTNIDSVMLGMLEGDYSVGIYDTAIKVKLVLSYMVTSLATVMLPKMSYYLSKHEKDKFLEGVLKTIQFSAALAIPMWIFVSITAKDVLLLVFSSASDLAAATLQILMPTVLLIGFSNIAGIQMLVPLGREKQAAISYTAGAAVNIVFNGLLIPRFSMRGAAAATVLAEAAVLLVQIVYLRREGLQLLAKVGFIKILLAAALPCPVLFLLRNRFTTVVIRLVTMGTVYVLLFFGTLFLIHILCRKWNTARKEHHL